MKLGGLLNTQTGLAVFLLTVGFLLFSNPSVRGDAPVQASTLDELVKMFDSSSCKQCHEEIYGQWEKSHHSRPLIGMDDQMLLTSYLKRVATPSKPADQAIKSDFPCFKCHLPQMKYGTDAVAGEIAKAMLNGEKDKIRKLNISCLVCHNEKAMVHGRPEKSLIYGNRDLPDHERVLSRRAPC